MTPGSIVVVDWRDAITGSREVNKLRPGIAVGDPSIYGRLPFTLVVPLTGVVDLAIPEVHVAIDPDDRNGCSKRSYALCWAMQTVARGRLRPTPSQVSPEHLRAIYRGIARCIGVGRAGA